MVSILMNDYDTEFQAENSRLEQSLSKYKKQLEDADKTICLLMERAKLLDENESENTRDNVNDVTGQDEQSGWLNWRILTFFVKGSIAVWLSSCWIQPNK